MPTDVLSGGPGLGSRTKRFGPSTGRVPRASPAGTAGAYSGLPLRIAMLAPPWISVPPPGYGGVESVVSALTEALVRRGHAVTLFCAPGSVSSADVVTLLDAAHPDEIERSLYEVDHVARAFEAIDARRRRRPLRRHPRPLRLHGARDGRPHRHADRAHAARPVHRRTPAAFYARHGHKAALVGSAAPSWRRRPPGWARFAAIPNPIDVRPGRCRSARTTTCSGSAG